MTPSCSLIRAALASLIMGALGAAQVDTTDHHPLFDRIDTNHDGAISLEEWQTFRAAHAGHHHAHRPDRSSASESAAAPAPGAPLTMAGLSHDSATAPARTPAGDAAAPAAGHPAPDGHRVFARMDTDHDGSVSLAEWIAWRSAHTHGVHANHRTVGADPVPGALPALPAVSTPPVAP